jgi:hypothetical protein
MISKFKRGFFNRYHKNMPWSERLVKDAGHLAWSFKSIFRHGLKRRVLIHPHYPSRKATIYRIARYLGYQVTNRPDAGAVLGVFYEYATFKKEFATLQSRADKGLRVLNISSRDISKLYVDKLHQEIFGYRTQIDPTQYHGKVVKKSDINALHDGQILDCPIPKEQVEEGFIYQILIDNVNEDGLFQDIRVAIVGDEMPIAYLKFRDPDKQFGRKSRARLVQVQNVMTPEEIDLVRAYMKRASLDFAEIDILRDNKDGRIYIIDVNDTPQSARDNVSKEELQYNIRILAEAFDRQFLKKS